MKNMCHILLFNKAAGWVVNFAKFLRAAISQSILERL